MSNDDSLLPYSAIADFVHTDRRAWLKMSRNYREEPRIPAAANTRSHPPSSEADMTDESQDPASRIRNINNAVKLK